MTATNILFAVLALAGFVWACVERGLRLEAEAQGRALKDQRDNLMSLAERQAEELARATKNDQRDSRGRFTRVS